MTRNQCLDPYDKRSDERDSPAPDLTNNTDASKPDSG